MPRCLPRLASLTLVVLIGCTSGSEKASPTTASGSSSSSTTSTTLPITTTTLSDEEQVKATYLAYWAMGDRIYQSPNPNDAEIATLVGDPALSDILADLEADRAAGRHLRMPTPDLNTHLVLATQVLGVAATITDCFVDGRIELDATEAVLDDDVVTKRLEATLSRSTGAWKVTSVDTVTRQLGVVPCAAV